MPYYKILAAFAKPGSFDERSEDWDKWNAAIAPKEQQLVQHPDSYLKQSDFSSCWFPHPTAPGSISRL